MGVGRAVNSGIHNYKAGKARDIPQKCDCRRQDEAPSPCERKQGTPRIGGLLLGQPQAPKEGQSAVREKEARQAEGNERNISDGPECLLA